MTYFSGDIANGYYVEQAISLVLIAVLVLLFAFKFRREFLTDVSNRSKLAYYCNRLGSTITVILFVQLIDHRGVHGLYPFEIIFALSGTQTALAYACVCVYAFVLIKALSRVQHMEQKDFQPRVNRYAFYMGAVLLTLFLITYARVIILHFDNKSVYFGVYLLYLSACLCCIYALFVREIVSLRRALLDHMSALERSGNQHTGVSLVKAERNLQRMLKLSFPICSLAVIAQFVFGIVNIANNVTVTTSDPAKYAFFDGVWNWLIILVAFVICWISWESPERKNRSVALRVRFYTNADDSGDGDVDPGSPKRFRKSKGFNTPLSPTTRAFRVPSDLRLGYGNSSTPGTTSSRSDLASPPSPLPSPTRAVRVLPPLPRHMTDSTRALTFGEEQQLQSSESAVGLLTISNLAKRGDSDADLLPSSGARTPYSIGVVDETPEPTDAE